MIVQYKRSPTFIHGGSSYYVKEPVILEQPSLPEMEMKIAEKRFIEGEIDVDEFERTVERWLKWETLSPLEKRRYEELCAQDEARRLQR